MTELERPKVKVEYVLFDMDGLLIKNIFSQLFSDTHVRSADRLGEDLLDRNKYVDQIFLLRQMCLKAIDR